jgi:type VI secretion system protein VasI
MKALAIGLIITMISAAPATAWQTHKSTSPTDDSTTVVIIQEAEATYTNRYGRPGRANLQILCEQNTTALALVLPELYTSDIGGLGKVTFRADSNPAFAVQMIASNDRTSLMVPSGQAIRSIKRFIGAESLFAQTLTVSESAVEVTFDLTGLDAALAPVRETCGW